MAFDKIFLNARFDGGARHHIAVKDGRIAALLPADAPTGGAETVDLGNALVVPGFVEGHIHLDTSFYGDAWRPHKPCTDGFNVHERVAFQAQNMAEAAPMDVRARNQLDLCIAHGSTQMRSHVMVDGSVGLKSLETILRVREEYRGLIDIQLVAFPQSGILASPGTPQLLDEAIGLGANLVGGLDPASFDRDVEKHLDVVFGVASKHGVDVDIHLHDMGTLGAFEIEQIAARTRALGMEGHVAISHAYGLGDIPADQLKTVADTLARSGVAIMTNAPGARAFPPILACATPASPCSAATTTSAIPGGPMATATCCAGRRRSAIARASISMRNCASHSMSSPKPAPRRCGSKATACASAPRPIS